MTDEGQALIIALFVVGFLGMYTLMLTKVVVQTSQVSRLSELRESAVWLAEAGEGQPYHEIEWRQPVALVIGSETHGPQPSIRSFASGQVNIPMMGKSESLNAAVAAAVILFEILRQRGST